MPKSERASWPLSVNYRALCSISHCWPLPPWNSSPPDFNETWLADALEVTGVLFKAFLSSHHTFPSWVSHSKGFSSHHWFQIKTSSVHIFTQQTYDLTWKLKLKCEVTVLSWRTFQYPDWWQPINKNSESSSIWRLCPSPGSTSSWCTRALYSLVTTSKACCSQPPPLPHWFCSQSSPCLTRWTADLILFNSPLMSASNPTTLSLCLKASSYFPFRHSNLWDKHLLLILSPAVSSHAGSCLSIPVFKMSSGSKKLVIFQGLPWRLSSSPLFHIQIRDSWSLPSLVYTLHTF